MDKIRRSGQSPKKKKGLLGSFSQAFQQLTEGISGSESDTDTKEKKLIYSEIADVLASKCQEPADTCLSATYILCRESDPDLLNEVSKTNARVEEFLERLKDYVLSVVVRYEPVVRGKLYRRQIEVTFIEDKKLSTVKVHQEIDWDYLPPDVRERCLRYGEEVSVFELYKQEN